MKAIEIAFTVYPVTDLKRARQFYEGVLGLVVSHRFGDDSKGMIEYASARDAGNRRGRAAIHAVGGRGLRGD